MVTPGLGIEYDLPMVDIRRNQCSHIAPDDWNHHGKYNLIFQKIWQAWLTFLDQAKLETRPLVNGIKLFVVPPCIPWFAPHQHSLMTIAVIMHYQTMEEAHGINNENHTSNAIRTNGTLRSCCWQLLRQSVGDEGYFGNCLKMEVSPVAIPYKEIKDVFVDQNDIFDIMSKYSVFVHVIIDTVHKVHLCSKTVAKKWWICMANLTLASCLLQIATSSFLCRILNLIPVATRRLFWTDDTGTAGLLCMHRNGTSSTHTYGNILDTTMVGDWRQQVWLNWNQVHLHLKDRCKGKWA